MKLNTLKRGVPSLWLPHKLLLIMKLTMFILIIALAQVSAKGFGQKITLNEKNTSVKKVLHDIEQQSGYTFFYDSKDLPNTPITVQLKEATVEDAVKASLKNLPLTYKFVKNNIVLTRKEILQDNQPKTDILIKIDVSGKVVDSLGRPLSGATVTNKNANTHTGANANGEFAITANEGDKIEIAFIGYQSYTFVAKAKEPFVSITLHEILGKLNEVVVVGYGTQRKSDVTGSLSSLSSKDFKDQPVTRIDQALQGRVAGVQVVNNSGAPGGDVKIRVRGSNSILGDNNPLYVIDGFIGGDFNNLNPDDIANIEVLKDASSTAIYGSRGANGVVLITTKKGNAQKQEITLTPVFYSSKVIKKMDLMNAADFATTVNARNAALNISPFFTQAQIDNFKITGGTNWQDLVFRNAPGQEYKLGYSGGNAKTQFFISGDYLNQDGIVINSNFKRYALRSNINTQFSDKLSTRLNISAIRRETLNTGNQGTGGSVNQALAWAPTTPVRTAAGTYTIVDPLGSIRSNPVALANDAENIVDNSNITLNGGANYRFFKDLSLDVSFGVDYQNIQGKNYSGPSITNNIPNASRTSTELINLQNTNTLNYSHLFNNVHSLNVTAVFEQQKYTSTGFSANANNLTFANLGYDNLALSTTQSAGSAYSGSALISYLGRVNYAFKDKYLLTVSVRRDGSSKFQPANQESTFPSIALGWKLSEESFIKKMDLFDTFKIRGSWGLTGSQAINPYATLSTYLSDAFSAANSFNNTSVSSGIVLGNAANPFLKWETTQAEDVGLDLSLFNNRLNFTADAYVKNTRDLLLSLPLPAYAGGGNIISNVGKMKNSGLEFNIGGTPVQSGKFTWSSSFNITFQKNLVKSLGTIASVFSDKSVPNAGAGLSTQPEFIIKPGYALGSYWGLKYLGTWKPNEATEAAKYGNKPGDSHYQDLNGDNAINGSDFQIIGNGTPKQSLGWNNTFTYGDFSVNVFVQSLLGFSKLDYSYASSITANADAKQATNVGVLNRYQPGINETSNIPAFSSTNKDYFESSRFLENGNFVRLKNLNISYHLPKGTIKNVDLKLFIGATNLFTITKYKGFDPESTNAGSGSDVTQSIDFGSYPNSKTFNVGAVLKF
ncbi:TonB-linked outer membrane protein, SusC/RagA family [Mucilaginibacter sp. OK283]|nr:TonB-linked outer membrane protein, SusC/RagA family [Mucilaginibacter sp. OK283]